MKLLISSLSLVVFLCLTLGLTLPQSQRALAEGKVLARSLSGSSPLKIQTQGPKPLAYIIFQSNCEACRKQVRNLGCLNGERERLRLIGTFSSESELRKEYQQMNTPIPAYYGDREVVEALGVTAPLTPQTLIFFKGKKLEIHGLAQ